MNIAGRLFLVGIFFLSAVGNKIPNFPAVVELIESQGAPMPSLMLVGGIALLLVGSASVALGFRARVGAALLWVFLVGATYYFHDFWNFAGAEAQQQQIAFMKNLSLMGAMLMIVARGAGPGSLDRLIESEKTPTESTP